MRREDDGVLVQQVRDGDAAAFAELFERWYDRVYDIARGIVRRPELAADVAQDALVAAWRQLDRLDDVNAFGGWLLRITRHKALDALRREGRSTSTDVEVVGAMGDRGAPSPLAAVATGDPVTAAEVSDTAALVWAAAAALGPRDASLLDLHLRHHMTPAELAADLGVEPNHAHQLVFRLRKRLEEAVGSFLLWRGGRPACAALAAATSGAPDFDADTAGLIRRHARACEACQAERGRRTRPAALFSAVPIVAAPLLFRARAAKALAAEGVPMASAGPIAPAPSGPSRWRSRVLMVAVAVLVVGAASLVVADAVRAPDGGPVAGPAPTTTDVVPRAGPTSTATSTTSTTSITPTTVATSTTTSTSPPTTSGVAPPPPPPQTPPPATPPPPELGPPVLVADPVPPATAAEPTLPPPAAPLPIIVRFVVLPDDHACAGDLQAYRAGWVTEGATSASLQVPNGSSVVVPTGQRDLCLDRGDAVTLTATSPAGSVEQTAVAG